MRKRLRPAPSPGELATLYPTPHVHTRWPDHVARVAATAALARSCTGPVGRAADLSCGDGAILNAIEATDRLFGDFAPGYEYQGPIEQTIHHVDPVDVFVCCETVEHLDDPDLVLEAIRGKTDWLVLSTPVDAWDDTNPEHLWAWSRAGVEAMLHTAGFTPHAYEVLDFRARGPQFYCFGMWVAR